MASTSESPRSVCGSAASVIAGWAPEGTLWLTDDVHADGDVEWVREDNDKTLPEL